jgi:hypothetical protein
MKPNDQYKPSIWFAAIPTLVAVVISSIVMSGCAILAGAAAGGAVGYVAGSEAGEDEAREELDARDRD